MASLRILLLSLQVPDQGKPQGKPWRRRIQHSLMIHHYDLVWSWSLVFCPVCPLAAGDKRLPQYC